MPALTPPALDPVPARPLVRPRARFLHLPRHALWRALAIRLGLGIAIGLALGLALELGPASAQAAAVPAPAATNLPPGHVKSPPPGTTGAPKTRPDKTAISEQDRHWWAFQPLQRPTPPAVKRPGTVRTPIDAFILARLDARGLRLPPVADRRTLLRRAALDLTGLPPSPEELADFERDRSPDAWARVIDRLLASPRHGERWARHWLDVARFAESSGFEHDYDRPNAYHYRDFVIRALNDDLPFDQFVRWQLAGDEYEPDNALALMATGFLGAGVFPTQITANEVERARYDAMDDMLATTGTAMLGLTLGCARCHDHKYDPIPMQDYYAMLATFTTTVRSDVELDLQPEANRQARAAFDREHAPLTAALAAYEREVLPAKFSAWLAAGAPRPAATWQVLDPESIRSRAGATFQRLEDGSLLAQGKNGDSDAYMVTATVPAAANSDARLRALRIEALAHPSLTRGGPGRADNGNFGLSRIRVFASPATGGGPTNEVRLEHPRATFQQNADHLSIAAALDDKPSTGWAIDPKFGTNHAAIVDFAEPVGFPGGTRLEVRLEFEVNTRHHIGRPRLSVTTATAAPFDGDALPASVSALLAQFSPTAAQPNPAAARALPQLSDADQATLLAWWKTSDPGWQALRRPVDEHARKEPKPRKTKVMICAEGYPAIRMHTQGADFFPETYFLQRGSPDLKKGVAQPGFLQVLLPRPDDAARWRWQAPAGARYSGRRRALAEWMTDADRGAGHLLARVIVNRLWQHHFGQGLVATPNDFGVQGSRPSHPELLDWLAAELIRGGWKLKPIHRLMMLSATYQQAPADSPAARSLAAASRQADPGNALLGRREPRRLEAEAVRDALLHVSGVLETNLYGPGTLDQSSRRRSIYFTVKRSQLIPAMQAFDAPEPLVSQGARPVTTVAPQALLLMNSPHVRAWAEAFARRCSSPASSAPGASTAAATARTANPDQAVLERAYALAFHRSPSRRELAEGLEFLAAQTARYQPDGAGTGTRAGTTAGTANARQQALADFAQVLFSLNEFIYVD